jgi:hypothetical protein
MGIRSHFYLLNNVHHIFKEHLQTKGKIYLFIVKVKKNYNNKY